MSGANSAERLVKKFGGLSSAARVMRVDRQLVYAWNRQGYIPAKYAYIVDRVTKGEISAQSVIDDALKAQGVATLAEDRQGK